MKKGLSAVFVLFLAAVSCTVDNPKEPDDPDVPRDNVNHENIIVLNEGNWQSDNGQLSFIRDGRIENKWFQKMNGYKLGDTPQDIVQINDTLIAISINWSNIIRYIRPDGTEVARTEDVPNCRSLCTDADSRYLYVTSYAHRTALGENYQKGYVAKIDLADFSVAATCEVGYEPEGVAWYDGRLFVANTGGYAYTEAHDYEHSVSVVDAASMELLNTVDILREDGSFVSNLYGEMSQSGRWLCINSAGNYTTEGPAAVFFNCSDLSYYVYDMLPATCSTTLTDGKIFIIGSSFSYDTYDGDTFVYTVDPETGSIYDSYILPDGTENLTVVQEIMQMSSPYCVYQNPYTGHLYVSDAGTYASSGTIFEYDTEGRCMARMSAYINPGHMLALPSTK